MTTNAITMMKRHTTDTATTTTIGKSVDYIKILLRICTKYLKLDIDVNS